MKKIILSAASLAVAAVASVSVAPTTSEAVPAFARQTGAACLNCHFQTIPRLAQMGREFRMGGFRDVSQDLIEDDHLSLPAFFNASLLMKARVTFTGGDVTKGSAVRRNDGATNGVQWPDESALLFGGRFSEKAGGFQEWDVISGSMLGGKFAYVNELDNGFIAAAIGTSDALGAPSIFNDPSNAISRNLRGIQNRAVALNGGILHGAATAVGVYGYMADSVYFAAGLLVPDGGFAAGNNGIEIPNSPYLRAAYITQLGDFDAIVGAWYSSVEEPNPQAADKARAVGASAPAGDVQAGLDFQLQGDMGDMSIGFYMPVVLGGISYNGGMSYTGAMPYVNIGLTQAAGVRLGVDYATSDVADDITKLIVGGWYDLAQNIVLDAEFASISTTANAVGGLDTSSTDLTVMLEYAY